MALGITPIDIVNKGTHPLLVKDNDWERVELNYIAEVQNGYAFSSNFFNHKDGLPLIRIRDIFSQKAENYYSGEYNEDFVVNHKDILIGMDGDFKISRWPGQKGLLNQRVCRLKFYSNYYVENFLFICVQPYLDAIHSETSAVTVKHLSSRTINEIPLPLPPLPIQRAIVSKIEALFSDLDNGIANFKKAQAQLKIYRQAVLKKAFEGELTNKNIEYGELPKDWKWELISEIAKINPPLPNKASIDRDLEVQFLPMKLVEEIINKIHLTETRNFVDVLKGSYTPFIDGDIIFAKVTPCMENGKIAIVNKLKNGIGFGSSEFHVLRCSDKINNSYLYNFIVQDTFRNKAQAAMTGAVGLRRVPKQFIENYLIPLPPTIEEQTQIVQEIERRLSVCDKMEQSITESIAKAEALRQSILKKAFEGKLLSPAEIDLCKKEADYEPASVLLEKIKAEKLAKEQAQKKATFKKKSKQ
jgi:type I restriction enzyme S subunit